MVNKHFMFVFIQVYRVSDMELVRVLPSAEDEVNVACFHPSVGGGLVYGTKVKTMGLVLLLLLYLASLIDVTWSRFFFIAIFRKGS